MPPLGWLVTRIKREPWAGTPCAVQLPVNVPRSARATRSRTSASPAMPSEEKSTSMLAAVLPRLNTPTAIVPSGRVFVHWGVAPLAIVFTAAVFVGALVVFRSGFVKVTPRFVSMTIMAGFGFLAVLIAGLFGLFPGLSSQTGLLVIGVIGVVIGVMYLFIDFNAVQLGEQRRLPAEAEWYGALMLMMSLVFVYINVLRVVASRRR